MPAQSLNRGAAESGSALVATLGLILLLAPLGAFVALQARTDTSLLGGLRDGMEAFYAAEAGLEHALAEIPPGTSLQDLSNGPDGIAGTADDGAFPFRFDASAAFSGAALRYDVRLESLPGGAVRLTSTGMPSRTSGGTGSAAAQVRVTVGRAPTPFSPAAVYSAGAASLDIGGSGFVVSGLDHLASDAPASAHGSGPAVPAVGSPDSEVGAQLRAACSAAAIGPCGQTVFVDVAALTTAARAHPSRVELSSAAAATASVLGSVPAPQLTLVDGSYDLSGNVAGAGVLVVDGDFRVTGALSYRGLVVVRGAVLFADGSDVRVDGGLWTEGGATSDLRFHGTGAVLHSGSELAGAEQAFPGLLPHAAVVTGWEEVM